MRYVVEGVEAGCKKHEPGDRGLRGRRLGQKMRGRRSSSVSETLSTVSTGATIRGRRHPESS